MKSDGPSVMISIRAPIMLLKFFSGHTVANLQGERESNQDPSVTLDISFVDLLFDCERFCSPKMP